MNIPKRRQYELAFTYDFVEDNGDLHYCKGGREVRPQVEQHLERRGAPHPPLRAFWCQ